MNPCLEFAAGVALDAFGYVCAAPVREKSS